MKRTFPFAKLCSRTPYHAVIEQRTRLISLWLLQLTSVAAHHDEQLPPRRWSGAMARLRMRDWLRRALLGRPPHRATTLAHDLARAVTDSCRRTAPKQRRHELPQASSESPLRPD